MHAINLELAGRTLRIETGQVARQASGSVLVQYGETVVLVSAVGSKDPPKDQYFFLPLTVDYRELAYAAGKIPGGFFKREGRPRDKEILSSRLIDRPVRPLFPENFRNELQITGFLLSSDLENEGDVLGIIGASAALGLSEIPFLGPIGAVRMGMVDGKLVVNPTLSQLAGSAMNIVVCGTKDSVIMCEGSAREVSDDQVIEAIGRAQTEIKKIVELQQELIGLAGKPKMVVDEPLVVPELETEIRNFATEPVATANTLKDKTQRENALRDVVKDLTANLAEKYPESEKVISYVVDEIVGDDIRRRIVEDGIRLDGRTPDEIRPISCQIGVLPRTHGSALFTRGQTQSLVVVTLGTKSDEQLIDDVEREEEYKSFMLHYNFPAFSTGEVRSLRGPGRREIGHGALAERSIAAVLPPEETFPYTVRIVSEILESNGSSSMATVCGASLSLMDAGVPVRAAVAGIAMGLVKDNDHEIILTDILGAEDHFGDMDFKVAGTKNGITGIQLDLKITGAPIAILERAIKKATDARLTILETMAKTIAEPRSSISPYAPKIVAFKIPKEKIGEVIGPGGKNIRKIIEQTGVEIDIDDDGQVTISAVQTEALHKAQDWVTGIVQEVEVGKTYTGEVKRIMNFGAFVEVLPGKEGLVHISQLSPQRVKKVEDVVKVGDTVTVRVVEVDDLGRINLTMRSPEDYKPDERKSRPARRPRR